MLDPMMRSMKSRKLMWTVFKLAVAVIDVEVAGVNLEGEADEHVLGQEGQHLSVDLQGVDQPQDVHVALQDALQDGVHDAVQDLQVATFAARVVREVPEEQDLGLEGPVYTVAAVGLWVENHVVLPLVHVDIPESRGELDANHEGLPLDHVEHHEEVENHVHVLEPQEDLVVDRCLVNRQ